ncbi:hypothetical protein NDR87_30030 [Nocardia sp. CDC159]|uniref:Uncharacterized protein n=1 Tax=Nocardia pulmonis TaxID=2951408 RepID=A0A9X2J271_9NOCA|nr:MULTISPECIES: hypothetical protein [Nocardia]MCM6777731.1 hypothetical protein [Nocardia pulmonis]MCM6790616.1 hypothetical protein [Nocardia sp. CDC159]
MTATAPSFSTTNERVVRRGSKEYAHVRANTIAATYYADRRSAGTSANLAHMWESFDELRFAGFNMYFSSDGRYRLVGHSSSFLLTVAELQMSTAAKPRRTARKFAMTAPLTLDDLHVGAVIRTRTGKFDGVVTMLCPASPPEVLAAFDAGEHRGPVRRRDFVEYRTLRNGKPFGPIRTAAPGTLTLIRSAESAAEHIRAELGAATSQRPPLDAHTIPGHSVCEAHAMGGLCPSCQARWDAEEMQAELDALSPAERTARRWRNAQMRISERRADANPANNPPF